MLGAGKRETQVPGRGGAGRAVIAFLALFVLVVTTAAPAAAVPPAPTGLLDPLTIPKYTNQLTAPPPVYVPYAVADGTEYYEVHMERFAQQILPASFPMTPVWGYAGQAKDALTGAPLGYVRNSPGPSFEATRGAPFRVTWVDDIAGDHMFPVDPTLHWADPNGMGMPMFPFEPFPPGYPDAQSPVPLIPHLHGGEVQSTSDGNPDAWFTVDGKRGPAYHSNGVPAANEAIFDYPNDQPATTLWYHDHALGVTRTNVMSGLAGFYLLRDPADTVAPILPSGAYEMPLVFQDRTFYADGRMFFPTAGLNPSVHPYWVPEFFGNTIMVNGKVWPNMNVDRGQYRFRLLDGSNARFYSIRFQVLGALTLAPLPFVQIGSDGGYLRAPVTLSELTIAPGERADILVDFSGLAPGTKVIVRNFAKTPSPRGAAADPSTVGQLMQFTVTANAGSTPAVLPAALNPYLAGPAFPTLPTPTKTRTLVLWEVMGALGPLEILLNGQKWAGDISELPQLGSTEEWVFVNPTADTHPMHLHLTQFQLVSRQKADLRKYAADWVAKQTDPGLNNDMMPPWTLSYTPAELAVGPYLRGRPAPAPANEQGWKDTIQVNPGEVTVIRVRFAPIDGSGAYPFDATDGPGYVWHCHIIDHEDNEMMRPYRLTA